MELFRLESIAFRTTIITLLIGTSACSSDRSHSPGSTLGTGEGSSGGAGGTSGLLNGAGAYGFLDGMDPTGRSAGSAGTSGASGGLSDAGPALDPYVLPPSVVLSDAGVALCGSGACACNNGIDDDGDGKLDGFDEECTGALDNDEGTFATGIPGDNSDPKWQDCFFDGNSGAGDDHCRYHADCLSGLKSASDPDCQISAECRDFCQARTPNGCDCFGCCSVQLEDSSTVNVFIGSACSLENVGDPELCPPCTPSAACGNSCAECELCPGKGIEDLSDSCTSTPSDGAGGSGGDDSAPPYTCDAGGVACDAGGACPAGEYCSLGCCLAFVIY